MYELDLYIARALGLTAAFLCMHDLFLTNSELDAKTLDTLTQLLEEENMKECISYKRDTLLKLPGKIGDMEDFVKLDLKAQMSSSKADLNTIVIMAILYIHMTDTLDHLEGCKQAWTKYAKIHKSFQEPCDHFTVLMDKITSILMQLYKVLQPLTMAIHTSAQMSQPKFMQTIYSKVLVHQAHLVCEYTKEALNSLK
jgi:hypothetical protein